MDFESSTANGCFTTLLHTQTKLNQRKKNEKRRKKTESLRLGIRKVGIELEKLEIKSYFNKTLN